MKQETINRMKKDQLLNLIKSAIKDINNIQNFTEKISANKESIDEVNNQINGEDGFLSKIKLAYDEIDKKLKLIQNDYNKICEDDEEEESIKTQLENLVVIFEEEKKKIAEFKKQIWGYETKNEEGEEEKIVGLFDNINIFHEKQKEKYDKLYAKIEKELLSGATTISLAKVFSDKVEKYKKDGMLWSTLFVVLMIILILYYGATTFFIENTKSVEESFSRIIFRAPFLIFAVWLAIFFGNRRAESKKLEESYKHKEVMARSFIGYKKSIEELNDEDNELLKKHMDNLLKAMKENSASFLDSKGENHPYGDLLPILKGKKKIKKQKSEL